MSLEPYSSMSIDVSKAFSEKISILGGMVAILDLTLPERELHLITPCSRALKHEIHELIVVNDAKAGPNSIVKGAVYIGFFEVKRGDMVLVGDEVIIKVNISVL